PDDSLVTVNGLLQIAQQLLVGRFWPFASGAVLSGEAARTISGRVRDMNAALLDLAAQYGAVVYDLHNLFRRVRESGITIGSRRLSADYFGGFYSLNGYYPGSTGHAIIADELVAIVNRVHHVTLPP